MSTGWIDSHGYEYETAKDFLLRNRAKTSRNRILEVLRIYPARYPEGYIQTWVEGYDSPTLAADSSQYTRRRNAELAAAAWLHEGPGCSPGRDGATGAGPTPHDAVRAAVQPEIPARVGA